MDQSVSIHHWRYEDGWQHIPAFLLKDKNGPVKEFHEGIVGWHCWAYCNDHHEFVRWMEEHCPTADCTPRFNSGDPMITVHITDKDEAAYFMLNFQVK
jgi:hypothetical protein